MEHQGLISSPVRGAARRLFGALALLSAASSFPACAPITPRGPEPLPPPTAPEPARGAPSWAGEPLGWDKLIHLESWLRSGAERHDPFWRAQGELVLGEGRASFAADLAAGRIDEATLRERVALARRAFERVLAGRDANPVQRARAERGLAGLEELHGSGPSPAGFSGLALLTRASWRAQRPLPARLDRVGGAWTRITVHHSHEVPGARFDGSLGDSSDVVRRIQRTHMDSNGWGDIAYHFLVDASGRVIEGRGLEWQGAHAGGENNRQNIGICLLGDFERRPPSPAALAALEKLLDELCSRHRIARSNVICHRDLKNTICPGDAVAEWVRRYKRGAAPRLAAGASAALPANAAPASFAPAPRSAPPRGGGVVR